MKKLLTMALVLTLAVSCFAGCGKDEKISANDIYNPELKTGDTGGLELPLTESTGELTWSVNSTAHTDETINNSYVITKLREMTGVNLKIIPFPTSSANEKITVLAASKQLPDIVGQGLDEKMKNDLCLQGAFAAVEDYIDILPNFKKTFVDGEASWIFNSYKMADGKLYGYFGYDWQRDINTNVVMYRKDIFDKHGLTADWNGPDEFYETIKKLKELYPGSTPVTTKTTDQIFRNWSNYWGMNAQNPYYDESEKIWKYTDIDPKYKEVLDFIRKLYVEGLIDPEFLTNTQASWTSKMTQAEKAFVTTDWIGRMEMFAEQTKDTVPGYDLRFAKSFGPGGKYNKISQHGTPKHVSNNAKTETAFKLLDFVFSPAGKELITMGIEGETYTIGADGMADYIEYPDSIPTINQLEEKYGMFLEGMYLSFDRRSSYFEFTEREKEAQDYAQNPDNMNPLDPVLSFSEDDTKVLAGYLADLDKAGKEFATKYVLGTETGDEVWNKWVEKAKKLGCDKVTEIYNKVQKEYDKGTK